ncbi:uncharacterized protein SOCE26_002300 [Sorangium cellulosum]|uniref:Uncharacterized protein n=2 Tax=Sorangium cellulosum TaxID=56 RepID=A0A2L0EHS7_SORCE|nr:uncharacterized protein SOCE26_002300 [Sorangium cellulosum]
MALNYAENYKNKAPTLAGVYPLTVTRFTCTCARNDEDKMCEQITARMGNLRIIKNVPFMRKGNAVIGMRSQGLVDESTGKTDTVDALFNGGIYWTGKLTDETYEYTLHLFKSEKDQCVAELEEKYDFAHKVREVDPGMYECEGAYHFQNESNGPPGKPTLPRTLSKYCSPQEEAQVTECYTAAAAFNTAPSDSQNLPALAETARKACISVPAKRLYQEYDAFMKGIRYNAD